MRTIILLLLTCLSLAAQNKFPPDSGSGWTRYTVTAVANGTTGCGSTDVGPVVFTGGGLNDATAGGTLTATAAQHTYTVVIDATGIPDTFKWKKDSGAFTNGVAIVAGPQTLIDGVTITFLATTGHTLNDQWVITAGLGCWTVNGALGAAKTAALTQNVVLFQLPANGYVLRYRIKSATACTGTTLLHTGLGTSSNTTLFLATAGSGYDLKAAVSNTNFTTATPVTEGSDTAAAVNVVASLTATVSNIDQIADGCSFIAWVLWARLP